LPRRKAANRLLTACLLLRKNARRSGGLKSCRASLGEEITIRSQIPGNVSLYSKRSQRRSPVTREKRSCAAAADGSLDAQVWIIWAEAGAVTKRGKLLHAVGINDLIGMATATE